MQNELVAILKSVGIVVAGVLIGNFIEKTLLSKKAPTEPTTVAK